MTKLIHRSILFVCTTAILFISLNRAASAQKSSVTSIGSRLEIFVDTALVECMKNLTLQIHSPIPAETVISFDSPWEGNGNHFVTVIKDGDLYRMYYRSIPGKVGASGKNWGLYVCYAESNDGIHFIKPNLGIIDFHGSKANNIIFGDGSDHWDLPASNFTPFLDINPACLPSERFKATGGDGNGLYALVSPDGIHWKQSRKEPIISQDVRARPNNLFDSQNVAFWDSVQKQYVLYLRDAYPSPGSGETIRGIRRSVSKDFLHWSDPEWLDYGNAPINQFYTNAITPYFRAPHIYFGFPMRFLEFRNAKLPKEYDSLRGRGLSDAVFINSRDGIHWNRHFTDAFIRPGLDPLNWTDRNNAVALGVVPTGGNEMSIYVLQHFRLPSNHLRREVLRLDGIVSVNATSEGGELITKPFTFTGDKLVVNYSTSAAGGLRVELQDADGQPLPRFALKDSYELFGDSVNQIISWDTGSDVSRWIGKPVRLRFVLREADLYSYQFQD